MPADVSHIAVRVCRLDNFVSGKIFFANVAKHEVVFETTGTSERAVARFDNLVAGVILFAMFAKTIMIVAAVLANLNAFAVAVDDFPRFGIILVAVLAVLIFVRIARIAVQPAGNFVATANAQAVSADIKDFEIVEMVFANGDFSVEVGMRPVGIAAETFAAGNVNVAFVATIFFGEPEIGGVFKFGQFALNEVAVKF